MKLLVLLFLSLQIASCTLYQSEGRELLEKNKNGIVSFEFNAQKTIRYSCHRSAVPPEELSGPVEVLETNYEEQGFSSYLQRKNLETYILVYESLKIDKLHTEHNFCRLQLLSDPKPELVYEAIDIGVFQLLDPSTRP